MILYSLNNRQDIWGFLEYSLIAPRCLAEDNIKVLQGGAVKIFHRKPEDPKLFLYWYVLWNCFQYFCNLTNLCFPESFDKWQKIPDDNQIVLKIFAMHMVSVCVCVCVVCVCMCKCVCVGMCVCMCVGMCKCVCVCGWLCLPVNTWSMNDNTTCNVFLVTVWCAMALTKNCCWCFSSFSIVTNSYRVLAVVSCYM